MTKNIKNVPQKIVKEIFSNLLQDDIANVRLVCKAWLEISSSSNLTTAKIESLPPDILRKIFENLLDEDVGNVRLVCRRWTETSSP